jgi:organic hydroperoxide reductase OsmC/OhrA
MERSHHYKLEVEWTGNKGSGTVDYQTYERSYVVKGAGKPLIFGSSDPAFRGDKSRYNPEELLVAALSSCHMLWYLHLCAEAGVIVTAYSDQAAGTMLETAAGKGQFAGVILAPEVTVQESAMIEKAVSLHHSAHELCYIARSVNFPVTCRPRIRSRGANLQSGS